MKGIYQWTNNCFSLAYQAQTPDAYTIIYIQLLEKLSKIGESIISVKMKSFAFTDI